MQGARAVSVVHAADGTRYHLLVVADPEGGLIVSWPDMKWSAWASEFAGGEIRPFPRPPTSRLSRVDLRNIGDAVDLARATLRGAP